MEVDERWCFFSFWGDFQVPCSEESEMILYIRVHISNICPYIVDFYVQCRLINIYRSHGSYGVSRGDFPTKSWGRVCNGWKVLDGAYSGGNWNGWSPAPPISWGVWNPFKIGGKKLSINWCRISVINSKSIRYCDKQQTWFDNDSTNKKNTAGWIALCVNNVDLGYF